MPMSWTRLPAGNLADIETDAKLLQQMRDMLTAIVRKAKKQGADEIVELATRTSDLVAEMQRRGTH